MRMGSKCRQAVVLSILALSLGTTGVRLDGQSQLASARPAAERRLPKLLVAMSARSLVNIYGRAIDTAKEGVPGAQMRLRNARTGRIVASAVSDRNGDFEFLGIEPGVYVPEMISRSGRLIAAGELLVAEYGQTVATIVRLPVKLSLFTLMRDSGAMTDALETNAVSAAAAGTSATAATGTAVTPGLFTPTIGTILNVATSAGILTRAPQGPPATPGQ